MPIKRRVAKSRTLDSLKMSELWYGPGSCLLAGGGYYHGDFYWNLDDGQQAAVVAEMREDWLRNSDQVLEAWDLRSGHDLWIGQNHHADQLRPWAEEEFGPCR